ncbi:MAG: hypothetical protein HQL22_05290 [Candidatus Omnitrophica bacterium]|nr:hypothetical protein [Candidatus Omnitrophota bacterium]
MRLLTDHFFPDHRLYPLLAVMDGVAAGADRGVGLIDHSIVGDDHAGSYL